jgi:Spy/CpxP family protein refolding chaperone
MNFLMIAAAAAFTVASLAPALADNDRNPGKNHGQMMAQHRPMPQRDPHKFHQGQVYQGHKLMYKNGYWGYQQPSNGVFIHINL